MTSVLILCFNVISDFFVVESSVIPVDSVAFSWTSVSLSLWKFGNMVVVSVISSSMWCPWCCNLSDLCISVHSVITYSFKTSTRFGLSMSSTSWNSLCHVQRVPILLESNIIIQKTHIEDIYHIWIKATHSFELTLNNGLQFIFIPTNTTNRHKGSTYVTIR